jgi:hypothetical protein
MPAEEVARKLGVRPDTVKRWLREQRQADKPGRRAPKAEGAPPPRKGGARPAAGDHLPGEHTTKSIAAMLKAEGPHVARVLLDMAKGGDVRAAGLIMKLLGDEITSAEDANGRDPDADQRELERELQSLSPAIGSEIVALLAKADAEAQARNGDGGQAVDGAGRRPRRLPWQEDRDPSDERTDAV